MKDYHIFANHAHVFPEEARPGCGIDSLKKLMDECSIERAVCFAPFPSQYKEYNMPGDCISWLAGAIKNDDSLVGFGTIDFDSGDITGQVNRIADLGFRGIKLHPAYQEFNIMGDKACEVYLPPRRTDCFCRFIRGCTGTVSRTISRCSLTKSRGTSRALNSVWSMSAGITFSARRWRSSATTITARATRGAYTRA